MKAVNEVGISDASEQSKYFKVIAPVSKESPVVQEPLTDIVTELNKKVSLSCVISGTPTPKINWFKNGVELPANKGTYENRVSKYIIENSTEETSAKYTCKATNEIGSTETSCFVLVQEKPSITIEEKFINQTLRTNIEYKVSGVIGGHPEPEIVWYKDNVKLEKNERYEYVYENSISTIIIRNLLRSDTGKYTIEAKNSAGSTTVQCYLKVIGRF